jgi:transcriptional regulator with XRE-family HTH domain
MNLVAIGALVKHRRQALGLSQARLARLGGLSRATINQLETGSIVDLGSAKLFALLDLLGLTLDAAERPKRNNALALASRTASVSYKEVLTPEALAAALVEGQLPTSITPQVATLLDEAPLPLIVGVVEEVARHTHCPTKTLWKHLVQWAHELQSPRAVWAPG